MVLNLPLSFLFLIENSSPLPQGGIRVGDPSISLLSHFDLEDKESVEKTVSSPRSLTPKNCSDCVDNPPSSEDISLSSTDPSSLKSGDQNISDEVTCNDTSNVSNRIDLLKSDIANNSELSAQSFHTFSTVSEKASSFLTPTSIMIGLLAIFFIVKSNSRII